MTVPELKPCPFCGRGAEFSLGKTGDGKDWHYTECVNCGATGPLVNYADHNIAINDALVDAWNRRADLAQPAQVRVKPTDAQINSACLSYRHDFGLMTKRDQDNLRFQANEWLIAWQKEARILAALEPQPDHRDEVIARLVEAAQICADTFTSSEHSDLRAALAAAKAVRR